MFELIMASIMMVVAVALLVFGMFRLKYYYDIKIVEYKEQKNLENTMALINQLPEITTKMMDDISKNLKKWVEELGDLM